MESRINVCVRIKPLKKCEEANEKNNLWTVSDESMVFNTRTNESYSFDKVFGEELSTGEIYEQVIKKQIESAIKGINVTIFAYGQTSSGKTFTMRGTDESPGLIPLTISEIFKQTMAKCDSENSCKVTCSYLEIYNESVNDLLDSRKKNLDIRESISQGVYIQDLTLKECKDEADMIKYLEIGEECRITASTNLNEESSRSHSVFRFNIETKEKKKNGEMAIRTSQINLVDLAGSEGVSKTRSEGIRFREGSNINKSLLALSKVIQRLSACQSKNKIFINYRDSKLTRILQPSLGGNSQTIVICTLSQLFCNYQESVKTLLFGQMAKNIRTIVNVNEVVKNKETIELKVAKQENEELKEKIYLLETKIKELSKIPETKQRTTPIKDNKQITEHISDKKEEAKDIEMEIECKENEVSNISVNSVTNSSAYLKEQIAYLHSKIFEKSEEIDRKDATIRKILAEKSEIEQKFEIIEIKETEARRELEHLREEAQKHKSEITIDEICKEMEDESKHKSLIEADGIKCFSFSHEYLSEDSNILSSIENQEIKGSEHESCNKKEKELKRIIVNQEKNIKKLNKELDLLTDNCHNMKDEIRCIAESERLKTDDLECAEKEISRLNEDIKFYQETNKELMNSIDEVERALHEFEECQSIPINTDNSASESSHQKASKRILSEENERLKLELANLQNEFRQQTYDSKQLESDLQLAEKSLETAESNIEILNETLEFMSNENIHFKDQLSKQKEALIYKRKEKHSLESDLEEIKKKFTQKKRTKKMEEKEQEQIKEKDLLMQECKDNTIEQLKDQLVKKEKEYVELKQTIDKVKRIQGDFDSMLKKEKVIFKEEFEKEKKALMQEIDEYKFKSYNVLNDNVNLKKKIKSLNNTILDKEIELKTLKQDKEKYMSEIVDLKVKIKQMEKEEQDKQHEIDEYKKESLVKLNKAKTEIDIYSKQIIENSEMIQNYNKFAKDMNGVIKLLIKESSEAIEYAREIPELSSDKNECYKTLLEQKAMLLKVERKIILKRQSGFKMPNKLEQKLKMGSSEEEHTTTDEYHHVNMERKKVKIVE